MKDINEVVSRDMIRGERKIIVNPSTVFDKVIQTSLK